MQITTSKGDGDLCRMRRCCSALNNVWLVSFGDRTDRGKNRLWAGDSRHSMLVDRVCDQDNTVPRHEVRYAGEEKSHYAEDEDLRLIVANENHKYFHTPHFLLW
jgi:hypothetical protein